MTYDDTVKKLYSIATGSDDIVDYYWSLNDSIYYNDYGDSKWRVIKELNHLCGIINERNLRLKTKDSNEVIPSC